MNDPPAAAPESHEREYSLIDEGSPLKDISDTAFWAAAYRATENKRSDALFCDPYAQRLAGPRGNLIAEALPEATRHAWVIVVRTHLIDRYIVESLDRGVDMVVNIAAGLDARPYRMDLPEHLRWVEVDLPGLIAYKEQILRNEKPVCSLERIGMDLSNEAARRDLFQKIGGKAQRAVVVTEGLLIYLTPEEASALARDLVLPGSFRTWIFDLHLPGLVRLLQQRVGTSLDQARAPLRFTANGGPGFFVPCGWPMASASSMLDTAARTKRLPPEWSQPARNPDIAGTETPTSHPATSSRFRSRRIDGFVCSSTRP